MSLAYDPGSLVLHFAEGGRWAEIRGTVGSAAPLQCSAVSGATFLLYWLYGPSHPSLRVCSPTALARVPSPFP